MLSQSKSHYLCAWAQTPPFHPYTQSRLFSPVLSLPLPRLWVPSADPLAAPVRSKIARPLWGAQAACHVPALLYIVFQRNFAVMFCDLFH